MSGIWEASRQLREAGDEAQLGLTRPQVQHDSRPDSLDLQRTPSLTDSLDGFTTDSDYERPRTLSR